MVVVGGVVVVMVELPTVPATVLVGAAILPGDATDTTARTALDDAVAPPPPAAGLDAPPVGAGVVGTVALGKTGGGGEVKGTSLGPRPEDSAEIRG